MTATPAALRAHHAPLHQGIVARHRDGREFRAVLVPIHRSLTVALIRDGLVIRQVLTEELGYLRHEYGAGRLTVVGPLLKVHADQLDQIISESLLIERWKKRRCTPPPDATASNA